VPQKVSVSGLSIAFGATRALERVSLAVNDGEFVSIVGPSGCGKSTMLNVIAGLLAPAEGSTHVAGIDGQGAGSRIGYMFQKDTLLPWATALENVCLPMDVKGSRDGHKARALMQLVDLTGFEAHYPNQLSGGMRKRVQLARLLAQDPDVLLMDEPFGALDVQTRLGMQNLINELWEEIEGTILFVTHDIPEAVYLADRIEILSANPGTIVDEIVVDLPVHRTEDLKSTTRFRELETLVLQKIRHAAKGGNIRITT
jgi:NitT/TauT family transport system ATP-binding protein